MNWNSSLNFNLLEYCFPSSIEQWWQLCARHFPTWRNNNQQQRTWSRLIFWWVREIVISFSTLPLPTFHQEICSLCGEMYPESDYIFTSPLIPIVWATIISHVDFSYSFLSGLLVFESCYPYTCPVLNRTRAMLSKCKSDHVISLLKILQ